MQQTLLPPATEVCFVILSSISEVTEILAWKAGSRKKKSENKNRQVAKDKIETYSKSGKNLPNYKYFSDNLIDSIDTGLVSTHIVFMK